VTADSQSLGKGLEAMSRFFVGDASLQDTLQRVSELACDSVGGADMVGITMLVEGRAKTAVFTDDTAPEVDSAQYETGVGPCLDAFRHRQVFVIDDMEADEQWRPFTEAAAAHGIKSSMSLPLISRHEGIGALNFYSFNREAFAAADVAVGLQFATQAAIVLANSQAYWDAHQLGQDMSAALRSRAVIEQAKGILIGAQRCSADDAFQILVRASQRENRKLRDIAEEIVTKASQPRPNPS
jgi:GAF domain-containing protein